MLFSYKNEHSRMLIVRCIGEKNFFVEKVILPFEVIAFEAPKDARVEIWGNELYGPKLEERIRISSDSEDSRIVA